MIRVYKTENGIVAEQQGQFYLLEQKDWDAFINQDDLFQQLLQKINGLDAVGNVDWLQSQKIVAPIG